MRVADRRAVDDPNAVFVSQSHNFQCKPMSPTACDVFSRCRSNDDSGGVGQRNAAHFGFRKTLGKLLGGFDFLADFDFEGFGE